MAEIEINGTTCIVNDIIKFGKYDWRILEIRSDSMLIITYNIIESRRYNKKTFLKRITWESSEIRSYLNGEFLDSFDKADSDRIQEMELVNKPNPWFGTKGGKNTKDKIFLLSIEEVIKYFGDSGQLENRPGNAWEISDKYNSARAARDFKGSVSWWWLRSPGHNSSSAANVYDFGHLYMVGRSVCWSGDVGGGIRPALWLNIKT